MDFNPCFEDAKLYIDSVSFPIITFIGKESELESFERFITLVKSQRKGKIKTELSLIICLIEEDNIINGNSILLQNKALILKIKGEKDEIEQSSEVLSLVSLKPY